MNWYVGLGLKVFISVVLLVQTVLTIGQFIDETCDWIDFDEPFNGIPIIISLVLYCITIPFAVWIFNL